MIQQMIGIYDPVADFWIIAPLYTRLYPGNIKSFTRENCQITFWKRSQSGRLFYKAHFIGGVL